MIWEFDDMSAGYLELTEDVLTLGRRRSPRGQATVEIPNATFVLNDPTKPFPHGIGRRYGKAIAAAEALCLLGGVADPQLMISVGSNFVRFLDGGMLHGAYGPRIRGHLPAVVEKIRQDRDTRQAVLQIWDARYDQAGWTPQDLPCTLVIVLSAYREQLEMSVTMRSNDLFWGTAHDVPMFTMLQLTVANALDLSPGPYTHNAVSLHAYERDLEAFGELHEPKGDELPPPWRGLLSGAGIEQGMERARRILSRDLRQHTLMSPTERWCSDVLDEHTLAAEVSRRAFVS